MTTDDLPARLEAVLTERYTELGNPFSAMRRQEKGPDGWPASHPVGPHHVAEVLRELLAAAPVPPSAPADRAAKADPCADPIECGHEAALGIAEMKLDQVRAKATEWQALAHADDWGNTPQDTVLADVGRFLLRLIDAEPALLRRLAVGAQQPTRLAETSAAKRQEPAFVQLAKTWSTDGGLIGEAQTLAPMFEGLHRLLATSSRDWQTYRVDAWLWAVLCGWDCEQDEHDDTCTHGALEETAAMHGWDDATVAKARRYRAGVRAITEPAADPSWPRRAWDLGLLHKGGDPHHCPACLKQPEPPANFVCPGDNTEVLANPQPAEEA